MIQRCNENRGVACLAALVLCLGPADRAAAADAEGRFVAEGPGRLTCEKAFQADQTGESARLLAGWMTGYMTAHHQLMAETFDLTPWQTPSTVLTLLKQYCAANPESAVSEGAQRLVQYLAPDRLRSSDTLVAVGTDKRQVVLYEVVVREVREKLAQAGFEAGPSLEDLAASVSAYQGANGLDETGLIDQRTLARLLR